MKKFIMALLFLAACILTTQAYAADAKVSALAELASGDVADADMFYIVDATGPTSKKHAWSSVKAEMKTYMDGLYQPLEATLTDIADGTITENLVNTANPWADNEVADDITVSNYLPLAGGIMTGAIVPNAANTIAIGSATAEWADLYLGDGGVIYFQNDQSVYLTPSAGTLTLTGAFAATSFSTGSSASPTVTLLDSDAPGADDEIGKIVGAYIDGADGSENGTLSLYVHEAGATTEYVQVDGKNLTIDLLKSVVITGAQLKIPSSNADPTATAGYLRHDSTISNFTNGGLVYYNGAAIKQLVDMTTATASACTDDQVVAYDADNDLWYCKDDANAGGETELDDIADPSATGSVSLGDHEFILTSSSDAWDGIFIENTHADIAATTELLTVRATGADIGAVTTLLTLAFTGDATEDSNHVYINGTDYGGGNVFSFTQTQSSLYRPQINYTANAAGAGVTWYTVSQTVEALDGAADYLKGYYVNWTNANHSAGNLHAFDAEINSNDAEATQIAYKVTGAGFWDYDISLQNGETISNATDTQIAFTGDESLIIDLDTATDNEIGISSGSGATQINFSALNLVTTGSILGAVNVVVTTDGSESPTAAQMYGTMFIADHGTATSDTTYTLPAAALGMAACFYDNGGGTGGIIIEIDDADVIILNGTALTAGNTIDSPGVAGDGANGDFICIMAIDATNWITLGRSGTWVDGGAT